MDWSHLDQRRKKVRTAVRRILRFYGQPPTTKAPPSPPWSSKPKPALPKSVPPDRDPQGAVFPSPLHPPAPKSAQGIAPGYAWAIAFPTPKAAQQPRTCGDHQNPSPAKEWRNQPTTHSDSAPRPTLPLQGDFQMPARKCGAEARTHRRCQLPGEFRPGQPSLAPGLPPLL